MCPHDISIFKGQGLLCLLLPTNPKQVWRLWAAAGEQAYTIANMSSSKIMSIVSIDVYGWTAG